MSESRLRKYLTDNLNSFSCHMCMVESHAVSAGIPDLNYCLNGKEGWIELKWWTNTNPAQFRPTQIAWFRRRVAAGGKPLVIWGHDLGERTKFYAMEGKNVPSLARSQELKQWERSSFCSWDGKINFSALLLILATGEPSPNG
jgi:hypothetical protein